MYEVYPNNPDNNLCSKVGCKHKRGLHSDTHCCAIDCKCLGFQNVATQEATLKLCGPGGSGWAVLVMKDGNKIGSGVLKLTEGSMFWGGQTYPASWKGITPNEHLAALKKMRDDMEAEFGAMNVLKKVAYLPYDDAVKFKPTEVELLQGVVKAMTALITYRDGK